VLLCSIQIALQEIDGRIRVGSCRHSQQAQFLTFTFLQQLKKAFIEAYITTMETVPTNVIRVPQVRRFANE
jgi:hypothetical protein